MELENTENIENPSINEEENKAKADKKQHGLGTSIIREIARKYNGRCDFYESEGMFCCQVTLMADTTVLN